MMTTNWMNFRKNNASPTGRQHAAYPAPGSGGMGSSMMMPLSPGGGGPEPMTPIRPMEPLTPIGGGPSPEPMTPISGGRSPEPLTPIVGGGNPGEPLSPIQSPYYDPKYLDRKSSTPASLQALSSLGGR